MVDIYKLDSAETTNFATDASANLLLDFGGTFQNSWFFRQWEPNFILNKEPSIAYLELYVLTAGVLIWQKKLSNRRVIVYCDNQSVVEMINSTSSKCKNCMFLIRLLVPKGLIYNTKSFARYIRSKANEKPDLLSHLCIGTFKQKFGHEFEHRPSGLPQEIWPVTKI